MKEIILIAALVGLFIFFISFFYKIFLKKSKKKETKKTNEKDVVKEGKKSEDIPEILKEVTTGNYMHDLSKSKVEGIEFEENLDIQKQEEVKRTNVEQAFDDIDEIGDDLDDLIDIQVEEIEEIEDGLIDEVDEDFTDDTLLGDIVDDDSDSKSSDNKLAKEYKGLSKEIKAILIANILDKKKK